MDAACNFSASCRIEIENNFPNFLDFNLALCIAMYQNCNDNFLNHSNSIQVPKDLRWCCGESISEMYFCCKLNVLHILATHCEIFATMQPIRVDDPSTIRYTFLQIFGPIYGEYLKSMSTDYRVRTWEKVPWRAILNICLSCELSQKENINIGSVFTFGITQHKSQFKIARQQTYSHVLTQIVRKNWL